MKNQDSTRKDAKITTGPQDDATSRTDTAGTKELSDEQLIAVVGGAISEGTKSLGQVAAVVGGSGTTIPGKVHGSLRAPDL